MWKTIRLDSKLSLVDILGKNHGKSSIAYQKSVDNPIDCIFGSPLLRIRHGGCLVFDRLLSNHWGIWMDIQNEPIYGLKPPPLSHPNARHLKLKDPIVVKNILQLYITNA